MNIVTSMDYGKLLYRKENTMADQVQYICNVCGYIYDGDVPFEELGDDYECPLCGAPKSAFEVME